MKPWLYVVPKGWIIALGWLQLALIFPLSLSQAVGQELQAPLNFAVTEGQFPPGDLRVTSDGSTSGQLLLQIDNLDPERASGKAETQAYILAGVPGRLPSAELVAAKYTRYLRGRAVQDVDGLPPGVSSGDIQTAIRFSELGQLRHLHVYTMTVTVSYMSTEPGWQDSSWVLRHLRVRIDSGSPTGNSVTKVDADAARGEAAFLRSQVVNSNIDPGYWIEPTGTDFSQELKWCKIAAAASQRDALYRFSIYRGGLYRIAASDLQKAGVTTGSEQMAKQGPVADWRVYRNGKEVAVYQPSNPDHIILPVGSDEFQNPNEAVYWVIAGGDNQDGAPSRLKVASNEVKNSKSSGKAEPTSVSVEVVAERQDDYHARLRPTINTSRWYWKSLLPRVTGLFEAKLPDFFEPEAGASLEVHYGITNYTTVFPAVRCFVNTIECGVTSVTAQQGSIRFTLPQDVLRSGINVVGLRMEFAGEPPDESILVQKLRFNWHQPVTADMRETPFNWNAMSPESRLLVPVQKDADAPILVGFTGAGPVLERGGPNSFEGMHSYATIPGASSYTFLDDNATTAVRELMRVHGFREPNVEDVDYVAVVAPELAEAIQPLLKSHEVAGLKVHACDVSELINQYNYGQRDGEAIRRYMRYLFSNAKQSVPKYLLLAGECSDYRGDPELVPSGTQFDMVPTIGTYVADGMHGDQGFSQIAGDDMVADVAVGRLSVGNAEQLQAMVTKFEAYRTRPLGDWIFRAEFLQDDNEEFPRVVQNVITRAMAPPAEVRMIRQSDYTYVPNLRVAGRRRSHEATARVLEDFNYGCSVLNFFGHGGPNLWSHERLFHLMDLPLLKNENRLPLVTCLSCDNAWMDYPVSAAPGRVGVSSSMGELLVRKKDGGAIGLFGPVAGASPYEHQTLVARLMEAIFRQNERHLGSVTMYAKNMYFNETRASALPEQYVLLGDPALELRVPVAESGLKIDPASLGLDTTSTVRVSMSAVGSSSTLLARSTVSEDYLSSAVVTGDHAELSLMSTEPSTLLLQANTVTDSGPRSIATRVAVESKVTSDSSTVKIGEASVAEFADLQFEMVEPVTPTGVPNEHEVPVIRFMANNSQTGETTTTTAFIRETTEALSESVTIGGPTQRPLQPAGFTFKRSLSAGDHDLELVLTRGLEPDVTTDVRKLAVHVSPMTDLEFVPGSARARSTTEFTQRSTIFLDAIIRNNGAVPARIITLHALLDNPDSGTEMQSINEVNSMTLDGLKPGEEKAISFRWENTDDAGEKHIYLVANRTRSISETRYDNNSIEVPVFKLKPMGNFAIRSLETDPQSATPGTKVKITATVAQDGGTTRGPVDLDIGFRNVQTDETTFARTVLSAVGSEPTVITRDFVMDARYNVPFVAINPAREVEELNTDDNAVAGDTILALPLSSMRQGATAPISFNRYFQVCRTWSMDPISTDVLEVSDQYTSTTGMQPVQPTWLLGGQVRTVDTEFSPADDNLWSFNTFKLEAGLKENAGEISFRFPAADPVSKWPYAIYANVAAAPLWLGGPVGNFEAKFGNALQWRSYQFASRPGSKFVSRVLLTTATLTNGSLDVTLRHTSGSAVIFSGMEGVALAGGIQSPLLVVDRGSRTGYVLKAQVKDAPEEQIWMQTRTGTRSEHRVQWRDWLTRNESRIDVRIAAGDALQWRVFIQPTEGIRPRLMDVTLSDK